MPENFIGGGLFVLVAAALWLVYLMPNWARRREYLATERNALRLQQTLRVLAETSETPEEVHLAVSSRSVNQQEQLLIQQKKKERAAMKTQRAANARALEAQLRQANHAVTVQQYRIRRSRLFSTVVLTLSVVALISGIALFQAANVAGVWLMLSGLLFGFGALLVLRQLAVVSLRLKKQRQEFTPGYLARLGARQNGQQNVDVLGEDLHESEEKQRHDRSWQPQPLPKPLYLSRQLPVNDDVERVNHQAEILAEVEKAKARIRGAQTQVPSISLAAREEVGSYLKHVPSEAEVQAIREATRAAQAARIAATESIKMSSVNSASASPANSGSAESPAQKGQQSHNPFQDMGVVNSKEIQRPDFDAAIRRRRAG